MPVRGVLRHQIQDHADAARSGAGHKSQEVVEGAVSRIDLQVIGDVIAVVAVGRGMEGQQPDAGHAQPGEVVQLVRQPREIADPVAVAVAKAFHVHAIDDRVLPPLARLGHARPFSCHSASRQMRELFRAGTSRRVGGLRRDG